MRVIEGTHGGASTSSGSSATEITREAARGASVCLHGSPIAITTQARSVISARAAASPPTKSALRDRRSSRALLRRVAWPRRPRHFGDGYGLVERPSNGNDFRRGSSARPAPATGIPAMIWKPNARPNARRACRGAPMARSATAARRRGAVDRGDGLDWVMPALASHARAMRPASAKRSCRYTSASKTTCTRTNRSSPAARGRWPAPARWRRAPRRRRARSSGCALVASRAADRHGRRGPLQPAQGGGAAGPRRRAVAAPRAFGSRSWRSHARSRPPRVAGGRPPPRVGLPSALPPPRDEAIGDVDVDAGPGAARLDAPEAVPGRAGDRSRRASPLRATGRGAARRSRIASIALAMARSDATQARSVVVRRTIRAGPRGRGCPRRLPSARARRSGLRRVRSMPGRPVAE